jgi:hypothetical protein
MLLVEGAPTRFLITDDRAIRLSEFGPPCAL